jgi:ADP-heptose:LPS heptosyltransferase
LSDPKSILVIQLRRIGDVILATPAVAALKKRYPQANIDFLVEPPGAQVLEQNPNIHRTLVYDAKGLFDTISWIRKVRALRYDWVIDYLGTPRSAILTAGSGAAIKAGPAHVSHRWAYSHRLIQSSTTHYGALEKIRVLKDLGVPSENADSLPKLYLAKKPATPDNTIGLVPSSRKITRRWPASSYAELGKRLRRKYGCDILVFWGPGERDLANEVVAKIGEGAKATHETKTLKEAAQLMAPCRLVVTNCNGPKHMAVALGVPTVTIHGSSDPISWNPADPKHLVVRLDDLFCIGCGLNRCPYKLECMTQLPPERVFAAAQRLLDQPAQVSR